MKVRSLVGLMPLFAVETLEISRSGENARFHAPSGLVREESAGPDVRTSPACMAAKRTGCSCRFLMRKNCAAFCASCWMRMNFCLRMVFVLSPRFIASSLTSRMSEGWTIA